MRFLFLALTFLIVNTAQAVDIQEVVTPKLGIKAWLVESHTLPMVNVNISFKAGSVFDMEDKNGIASLTASLLSEGSGDMDAATFTKEIEKLGGLFSTGAGKLSSTISMRMLSENKEKSFALIGQAITNPRFDAEDFERVKDAKITSIQVASQNSSHVAHKLLKEHLYENHPYGHPAGGTESSLQNLSRFDVKRFYDRNYHLKNMVVSVVGDIQAAELATYLDEIFSGFKEGEVENEFPTQTPDVTPVVVKQEMNVPQSTVYLAHKGITRENPDYYAVYFMNYILGGGGFNSRLMEEIREKRGLAYGVYSYFEPMPGGGSFIASVSTKNADAPTSIRLIKEEMERLKQGVSDAEYEGAMSYLKGSFPLRLDSSSKVLGYLNTMQLENLGMDYLDMWTTRIGKVTKEDVKRMANKYLHPENLMTVVVGGAE